MNVLSRWLKNVGEVVSARRKSAKKRSLHKVNEHFEPAFNAAMATQVVFQRLLDHRTQLEYGQVHGDHQAAYHHAEEGHDHGLQQGGEAVHHVVDGFFVEQRHLVQHLIERTGLFTDGRHLHEEGREQGCGFQAVVKLDTGGYVVANTKNGLFVNAVTRRAGDRGERVDQGHTGGK